jgi:hypothetical protein
MNQESHHSGLTWEEFQNHLTEETPFNYGLTNSGSIYLRTNPKEGGVILDLHLESHETEPDLSTYEEIQSILIHEHGNRELRISVFNDSIYREFLGFCQSVANHATSKNLSPIAALLLTLKNFPLLFDTKRVISNNIVIGLFGELWVLSMLLDEIGPSAVDSWTGPEKQAHDFRRDHWEIEVKTTTSEQRKHSISSLDQLSASQDKDLFLISVQITSSAGRGSHSVFDLINACRSKLGNPAFLAEFDRKVDSIIPRELQNSSQKLKLKYSLRSPSLIIKVDKSFPKITTMDLLQYLSADEMSRIRVVTYEIEVGGMGTELIGKSVLDELKTPGD